MKWVMRKYLNKPYRSFGVDVGFADWIKRSSLVKECSLNELLIQLYSYTTNNNLLHYASCNIFFLCCNFLWLFCHEEFHSQSGRVHQCSWQSHSPLSSLQGYLYLVLLIEFHDEEFADLSLNDFLVAQRQVARQKLEHLQLTPHQGCSTPLGTTGAV